MELLPMPACPICGSPSRRRVGLRGDRPIMQLARSAETVCGVWRCRRCRHTWCDPVPSAATLAELYSREAEDYFAHLEAESGRQEIALLEQWAPQPGRLLDVGCGNGRVMQAAAQRGWQVIGVEPTAEFARQAARHGTVVDRIGQAEGPFDAVIAMAVLEHVQDPLEMLREAANVSAPGAVLLLEVPNGRRPDAWLLDTALRVSGRPWTVRTAPLQTPFHLSEFSHQSLRVALGITGWEPVSLRADDGHTPYPLSGPAAAVVRVAEAIGRALDRGLNLTAVARRLA